MNNNKEKTYSTSDLLGRDPQEGDRMYSEAEVEQFSDLFSEFHDQYGDQYESIDDAYNDFFDAYSNVTREKEESKEEPKERKAHSKLITRGAAGVVGAAGGLGVAHLLSKKDLERKRKIIKDMSLGRASSSDIAELEKIKKKINRKKAIGTAIGAGTGVGSMMLMRKALKNKNYSNIDMNLEDNYDSVEDVAEAGKKLVVGAGGSIYERAVKGTEKGAGAGALLGGAVGALAHRRSPRHKQLLAKKRLGRLSSAEAAELEKLRKDSAKKRLIKAGVGTVAGAGVGAAAGKFGAEAYGRHQVKKGLSEVGFSDSEDTYADFKGAVINSFKKAKSGAGAAYGKAKSGAGYAYGKAKDGVMDAQSTVRGNAVGAGIGGAAGAVAGGLLIGGRSKRHIELLALAKKGKLSQREEAELKAERKKRKARRLLGIAGGGLAGSVAGGYGQKYLENRKK